MITGIGVFFGFTNMIIRKFSSNCAYVMPSPCNLLQSSLTSILSCVNPREEDRLKRENALREFRTLVESMENMKGAVVKPFGSFVSNLYTKWGDLDICLNLPPSRSTERSSKLFSQFDILKALEKTGAGHDFKLLPFARVPLLIYKSSSQKIHCDVTIDNEIAVIKTHLIHRISEMDWRFRDLVLLIKEWAKAYDVNDAKQRTLNSLSIYLLVMFHFQTCEPAILPPLKDIYPGNVVSDITGKGYTENDVEEVFATNIAKFKSTNDSSLDELFISFFEKFSAIGSLSSQYVICTYTGRWENILSKPWWLEASPFDKLFIEDPFRLPENAACSVGAREMVRISNAFMETHRKLSSSDVLSDRDALLTTIVRPEVFSQLGVGART